VIKRIKGFFAFWYDFVVGDDWRVAIAVTAALALTYGVGRSSVPASWIVPAAVVLVIPFSLWRAIRSSH
jgi:hypothetical protein